MWQIYYIYEITKTINDKKYIGSTWRNIYIRLCEHIYNAIVFNKERKFNKLNHFIKTILSEGNDPSKILTIKIIDIIETDNKNNVLELEQWYINKFDTLENGYNTINTIKKI